MDRKITAESNVAPIAFSKDGKLLHGICTDHKVRTWDAATGKLHHAFALTEGDAAPCLEPDGLTTVAKDGSLKRWDLTAGKVTKTVAPGGERARRITVAPDQSFFGGAAPEMVGGSATTVRVHDASGKERFKVPAGLGGIAAFAVSPDGKSIVASSYDADVRAWNSRNGELLRLIDELPVSMFTMKFSPDGKFLAAAGVDRTIYLYDTKTWRIARKLDGQPDMISALAYTPDGQTIVAGGFSAVTLKKPVKVLFWDVASGKPRRTVDAGQRVSDIAITPDGKTCAVSTGLTTIDLWSI